QAFASNYQDKFEQPLVPLFVPDNPRLSVFIRIDPYEPPQTLLLELNSNLGSHKALWGDPKNYGVAQTDSGWMGELPERGTWLRVEIPADKINLKPGAYVNAVSFTQFGGIAWWDGLTMAGEVLPATDPRSSFRAWWKHRAGKDTPGVPGEL